MLGLQIALIVFLVIFGIYVLLLITDIIFVLSFNKFFSKHLKAMIIFLNMKFDNVKRLMEIVIESGTPVDNKFILLISDIHREDFDHVEGNGCKTVLDNLTYIKDEILYISRGSAKLQNDEEFKLARQNIATLENQYRASIATYNADVLGYNYWISFFPTRFIWKLMKFKPKAILMN